MDFKLPYCCKGCKFLGSESQEYCGPNYYCEKNIWPPTKKQTCGKAEYYSNKKEITMDVDYFYCNDCGYEDNEITVEYSRTVANGDLVFCPECGAESSGFEIYDI